MFGRRPRTGGDADTNLRSDTPVRCRGGRTGVAVGRSAPAVARPLGGRPARLGRHRPPAGGVVARERAREGVRADRHRHRRRLPRAVHAPRWRRSCASLAARDDDAVLGGGRRHAGTASAGRARVGHRRYLSVPVPFFDELQRLVIARNSRTTGRSNLPGGWRDARRLAGTFLLRTLDRGERVGRGMRARGGDRPPSPYSRSRTVDRGDYALVALAVVAVVGSGVVRWGL